MKTCSGCRALEDRRSCAAGECALGFKITPLYPPTHLLAPLNKSKPSEMCPKPITIIEYLEAQKCNI